MLYTGFWKRPEFLGRMANLLLIMMFLIKANGFAQEPVLVKDYNTNSWEESSSPSNMVTMGDHVYFAAGLPDGSGLGLWQTDGSEAGTILIKVIKAGAYRQYYDRARLERIGNQLLIFLLEDYKPMTVWRSDGTPSGTYIIKSINHYTDLNTGFFWEEGVAAGNQFFFVIGNAGSRQLWRSDGTAQGTIVLHSFEISISSLYNDLLMKPLGNNIFFTNPSSGPPNLWTTDGTVDGTGPFMNFLGNDNQVDNRFSSGVQPNNYIIFNNKMLLFNETGVFASFGTTPTTVPILSLQTSALARHCLTSGAEYGNTVYFVITTTEYNTYHQYRSTTSRLFRLDSLTGQVAEATEIIGAQSNRWIHLVGVAGNLLFFSTFTSEPFNERYASYRTAGSAASTVQLNESETLNVFEAHERVYLSQSFMSPDGYQFVLNQLADDQLTLTNTGFGATSPVFNQPANQTFLINDSRLSILNADGSVTDLAAISPSSSGTVMGNSYYFRGANGEPWISDGTASGTRMIRNIVQQFSDRPSGLYPFQNKLYFSHSSLEAPTDSFWGVTDGSEQQTKILIGTPPPDSITEAGNRLIVLTRADFPNSAICITDGTESGTIKLHPNLMISDVQGPMILKGNMLIFGASMGNDGNELRGLDINSQDKLVLNVDLAPGNDSTPSYILSSSPRLFTDAGEVVYFICDQDGGAVKALGKTDGTAAGTAIVKTLGADEAGQEDWKTSNQLAMLNGSLIFTAYQAESGWELWRSDGTEGGTTLFKDINPGTSGSAPQLIGVVNGRLLLIADDGTHGLELWATDGTAEGTQLLHDIFPRAQGTNIKHFLNMGSAIYFSAEDESHGQELWTSNGTPQGTRLADDIYPGMFGSFPADLIKLNASSILLTAEQPGEGREILIYDTDQHGTQIYADLRPGPADMTPYALSLAGDKLFFAGTDQTVGTEIWYLPLDQITAAQQWNLYE